MSRVSLRRILGYWRRHGLRKTVDRVVAYLSHGSEDFIITRVDLAGPRVSDRIGDVVLRPATPLDLPRLDQIQGYSHRAALLREHVEHGAWLFLACHGERIVAVRTMMRAVPAHDLASKILALRPGQAWDHDMFCDPDYRGRAIARQLSLFSDRCMHAMGYEVTFARISTSNVSSLRMQLHKGSAFAYHASYRRFLFFKRLRVSRRVPKGRPGSDVIASLPRAA